MAAMPFLRRVWSVFMPRGLQVAHTEVEVAAGNSPTESFDMDSTTATRVLDVAWSDRSAAISQLLGYSVINAADPDNPSIHRYLPDFHPEFEWLVATKITSTRGIGARGYRTYGGKKIAIYEKCRFTVMYSFPDYDLLEDNEITSEFERYRTFEARPAGEYLSVPPVDANEGNFVWSEGPSADSPFPGNVGFIVGTIDFHWRWLQVPFEALPFNAILDTIGRTNKSEFAGCPAGSLLLTAVDYKRVNSPFGRRTWNIEYTARYNPRLHGVFYNFEDGEWEQASKDGVYYPPGSVPDGKLLYDERDYEDLFTPPALVVIP